MRRCGRRGHLACAPTRPPSVSGLEARASAPWVHGPAGAWAGIRDDMAGTPKRTVTNLGAGAKGSAGRRPDRTPPGWGPAPGIVASAIRQPPPGGVVGKLRSARLCRRTLPGPRGSSSLPLSSFLGARGGGVMGSEPVRVQICRRAQQHFADAQRQNAEHQVAESLPVVAHPKMAPTDLVLEAGVHSSRGGAFAVSPALGIRMADGAPCGCRLSQFLLALGRTARIVVDDRNMAQGSALRPDLHSVIGAVNQTVPAVDPCRGPLRHRDRGPAAQAPELAVEFQPLDQVTGRRQKEPSGNRPSSQLRKPSCKRLVPATEALSARKWSGASTWVPRCLFTERRNDGHSP